MENRFDYTEQNRLIAKILKLHYLKNLSQAEIAEKLGLSAVKVNRLLKTARQAGMIEINIKLPFPNLFDMETRLSDLSGIEEVIVVPSIDSSNDGDTSLLVQVAAAHLTSQVHPKDSICIGGGHTISEVINTIESQTIPGLRIYPAIGGVQREHSYDVNSLANRLAQKFGGEALQFYAPAFAETEAERDTITSLTHVNRALEQARTAKVGLFGIGTLQINSSIIQYCSLPYHKLAELVEQRNGIGEILGYVIDSQGQDCIPELSCLVVGISLEDARKIPVRIGVAVGENKSPAIAAAIRGKYFTSLIIDENAAEGVLNILENLYLPVVNQ